MLLKTSSYSSYASVFMHYSLGHTTNSAVASGAANIFGYDIIE